MYFIRIYNKFLTLYMNICQKDIYLIFLNLIIIYLLYKDFNKKEGFDNISDIKTTF
jgi:hypothetical protein